MNQTRFIQPIVYLCVAWLGFTSLAHAEKKVEQPKRALNDVHERLESLKKELNESKEAHKDAADALKDSEKAISEANKKLYEIAKKQQANKETLSKLQQDSERPTKRLPSNNNCSVASFINNICMANKAMCK
jgi:septal ring factor EnvC (AmiA/AmiB activator)